MFTDIKMSAEEVEALIKSFYLYVLSVASRESYRQPVHSRFCIARETGLPPLNARRTTSSFKLVGVVSLGLAPWTDCTIPSVVIITFYHYFKYVREASDYRCATPATNTTAYIDTFVVFND